MLLDVRGESDFVKVCDFGIAKVASERDGEGSAITMAGMVCGTPEYMSPEQARGDSLDGRSDLYAMAVILYQMVAGDVPFRAESALGVITKHLTEEPTPPSKRLNASVPAPLEAVIMRGLQKNKEQRFATAAEMRAALFDALGVKRPSSSTNQRAGGAVAADAWAATGVSTPASTPAQAATRPAASSHPSVHGELAAQPAGGKRTGMIVAVLAVVAASPVVRGSSSARRRRRRRCCRHRRCRRPRPSRPRAPPTPPSSVPSTIAQPVAAPIPPTPEPAPPPTLAAARTRTQEARAVASDDARRRHQARAAPPRSARPRRSRADRGQAVDGTQGRIRRGRSALPRRRRRGRARQVSGRGARQPVRRQGAAPDRQVLQPPRPARPRAAVPQEVPRALARRLRRGLHPRHHRAEVAPR